MKASRPGRFRKSSLLVLRPILCPNRAPFICPWSRRIVLKVCSPFGCAGRSRWNSANCSTDFVAQLALFLHKERALHENRAAQLAAQSQKFQKTLFDCVSHELKTPLAAISAILQQPAPDRAELLQATRRLTNTVENLLDATRLESGLLQPVREWCDPAEILREAMQQVIFEDHPLKVTVADSLPHVSIDARLIDPGADCDPEQRSDLQSA